MIKTLLICIVALICSLSVISAAGPHKGHLTLLSSVIDARRKDPDHPTSFCHAGYDDCYDGHCCKAGGQCCDQIGTCCGRGYYCVNKYGRSGCCPHGHVCNDP